ncbi:MAG: SMC-Scp complex subunit ScpB [Desulfatitalea sp.]|nr:SMC-Scp complex subunit ScpB [Desulfatitalea sp.]
MQDELKHIIESLLFVADEPLTIDKLRGIIETADGKQIRSALESLTEEYERRGGGFLLREVAGGWQMRTRPEYHEWIKRMLQPSPQRLSRAALETLALIAYKQPIIRADIEYIRGVDCGGVLRQLMERKLIRVLGRKEIAGRPLIYATTKLFLEMFDLKDLNELPSPIEIAEFSTTLNEKRSSPPAPSSEVPNGAPSAAMDPLSPSGSGPAEEIQDTAEPEEDADSTSAPPADIDSDTETSIDDTRADPHQPLVPYESNPAPDCNIDPEMLKNT